MKRFFKGLLFVIFLSFFVSLTASASESELADQTTKKYIIKFDGAGADSGSMKDMSCSFYNTYSLRKNTFTRKGYTFTGWNTKKNGSGTSYADEAKVKKLSTTNNKVIILYAQWKCNNYKIAFNGNGSTSGSMKDSVAARYGKTYVLPENKFSKKGFCFSGWNTKADGSGKSYPNKGSVKNLTVKKGKTVILYAQWTKKLYKITYVLNGGSNNYANPTGYYITSSDIVLKDPVKENVRFTGWYSDAALTQKVTVIKKGSTGNKTLYAGWSDYRTDTGINYTVNAVGSYINWDGTSNLSHFVDYQGYYCLAYYDSSYVYVVKTSNGKVVSTTKLKKEKALYGNTTCDDKGNYYVATGEAATNDDSYGYVWVTKYNNTGKRIKAVKTKGDYFGATAIPFDAGNCSVAINNGKLVVNYAREMTSGHQSNSVWILDCETLSEVEDAYEKHIYNSHSFAQRAIAFGDGFLYASEGDAYPRAFSIDVNNSVVGHKNVDTFHFWIEPGYSSNMYVVNNNFAHMGDIVALSDTVGALVGTSVEAMNSNAAKQKEHLFLQIFDASKDMTSSKGYITSGKRSGTSGISGLTEYTDYGVKWIGKSDSFQYCYPQAVVDGDGNIVILYERYDYSYKYCGVYYMVYDSEGNMVKGDTLFMTDAKLNRNQTPVCHNGVVTWTANTTESNNLFVYKLYR